MRIVRSVAALRRAVAAARSQGRSIGLVPTMGALHAGHLALVKRSVRDKNFTVVSIFVNPLQFGPGEDLDRYPRRLPEDAALVASAGAELVFAPPVVEMYPHGPSETLVVNEALENFYCGAFRPGHFRGVLTVVAKLFHQCGPDKAYFGKKDYQQLHLIRRMVLDLDWNLKVIGVPTVREKGGLAMSSRNEYLPEAQRSAALALWEGLCKAKAAFEQGKRKVAFLRQIMEEEIQKSGGSPQYVEFADPQTLQPLEGTLRISPVLLVAAHYGQTRLIDNLEF